MSDVSKVSAFNHGDKAFIIAHVTGFGKPSIQDQCTMHISSTSSQIENPTIVMVDPVLYYSTCAHLC